MELPNTETIVFSKLSGTYRRAKVVNAVNSFFDRLNKRGPWEAIDLIISRWEVGYPQEKKDFYKQIKAVKESRNNKHASSKKNEIRYLAEIPTRVKVAIDRLIPPSILQTNTKDFYRKFAKRYPQFAVPEKI